MPPHSVHITRQAEIDLTEIWDHIAGDDSFQKADDVFEGIADNIQHLCRNPMCGHMVRELEHVEVEDYREIHYKPYRIIYTIDCERVYIIAVLDGRRDIQTLLYRRISRI